MTPVVEEVNSLLSIEELERSLVSWETLNHHDEQQRYSQSDARFVGAHCGRRSGKTEIAIRKGIIRGASFHIPNGRFGFAAPTRQQAKEIFWDKLKRMVPKEMRLGRPNETELKIRLYNGSVLQVGGLEVPERWEGPPLDGIVITEYGNVKPHAWPMHIRPALDTMGREGWCIFEGVPEGKNHYYRLHKAALSAKSEGEDWDWFHWKSAEILPEDTIRRAKRDMDDLEYRQEYEAEWLTFEGRIYYAYEYAIHGCQDLPYNKADPLVFTLDFNRAPGTAGVLQEGEVYDDIPLSLPPQPVVAGSRDTSRPARPCTLVLGEIFVKRNSTTELVCERLIEDWGTHPGRVFVYGDATGGAEGSAKLAGSDWVIAKRILKKHFGNRVIFRVQKANPRERIRVNSLNQRICAADHTVSLLVDPKAPRMQADLESVIAIEGGGGRIDKNTDPELTHLSDGLGYYTWKRFPLRDHGFSMETA